MGWLGWLVVCWVAWAAGLAGWAGWLSASRSGPFKVGIFGLLDFVFGICLLGNFVLLVWGIFGMSIRELCFWVFLICGMSIRELWFWGLGDLGDLGILGTWVFSTWGFLETPKPSTLNP